MLKLKYTYYIKVVLAPLFISTTISNLSLATEQNNYDPGEKGEFNNIATYEYKIIDKEANNNDPNNPFKPFDFDDYIDVEGVKYSPYVEVEGVTYFPEGQSNLPVIVLLHGRHVTCYNIENNKAEMRWPCKEDQSSIPSYKGYEYLGKHLASQGYFVVSISANGINAIEDFRDFEKPNYTKPPLANSKAGKSARARLINHHLNLLWAAHTYGTNTKLGNSDKANELAGKIEGRLDFQRIGLMGHSRGGEGVLDYAKFNAVKNDIFNVRSVLLIGSTNTHNMSLTNASLGSILPYCDGDVKNLESARIFDKTIKVNSNNPHYQWTFMGGNHNYFNTTWSPGLFSAGTQDDWVGGLYLKIESVFTPLSEIKYILDPHCGGYAADKDSKEFDYYPFSYSGANFLSQYDAKRESNGLKSFTSIIVAMPKSRFSEAKTQNAAKAYTSAFFHDSLKELNQEDNLMNRAYLIGKKNESAETQIPPSSQLNTNEIKFAFQLENSEMLKVNINNVGDSNAINCTLLKSTTSYNDDESKRNPDYTTDKLKENNYCHPSIPSPHTRAYYNDDKTAIIFESNLSLRLQSSGSTELSLRNVKDISQSDTLSFRVYSVNKSVVPEISVQLLDAYGNASHQVSIDNPEVLNALPGNSKQSMGILPRALLHTATVKLSKFNNVDLSQVTTLRLIYNTGKGNVLDIADITFSKTD
ncbi:hypothetical protein [Spartinivicinus poritis]|uniref:Alpha/beta hydrolase n=1 Tax=Spartinivicinus poritis TaxID=2994640 RepID=A0ABT5UF81_9GAMM|nr:hypothetical protein [Spartinivicinus sp. A2-2]MDE1464128.1 hypothetical protein [Spartinivicinus sp. A2-2]